MLGNIGRGGKGKERRGKERKLHYKWCSCHPGDQGQSKQEVWKKKQCGGTQECSHKVLLDIKTINSWRIWEG